MRVLTGGLRAIGGRAAYSDINAPIFTLMRGEMGEMRSGAGFRLRKYRRSKVR